MGNRSFQDMAFDAQESVWKFSLMLKLLLLLFIFVAPSTVRRLFLLPPRLFQGTLKRRAHQAAPGRRRSIPEPAAQARQRCDTNPQCGRLPRAARLRPGALHPVHHL